MARIAPRLLGISLVIAAIAAGVFAVRVDLGSCTERGLALRKLGLQKADGTTINLGPVDLTPPEGSFYRTESGEASVFRANVLFCDSGDWGFNAGNQVRIKLYDRRRPVSDVLADVPAEQVNQLRDRAASVGSIEDEIVLNGLRWSKRTEFWNLTPPKIRSVYMASELPIDVECCRVGITFFAEVGREQEDLSTLTTVVDSLKPARETTERTSWTPHAARSPGSAAASTNPGNER